MLVTTSGDVGIEYLFVCVCVEWKRKMGKVNVVAAFAADGSDTTLRLEFLLVGLVMVITCHLSEPTKWILTNGSVASIIEHFVQVKERKSESNAVIINSYHSKEKQQI